MLYFNILKNISYLFLGHVFKTPKYIYKNACFEQIKLNIHQNYICKYIIIFTVSIYEGKFLRIERKKKKRGKVVRNCQ